MSVPKKKPPAAPGGQRARLLLGALVIGLVALNAAIWQASKRPPQPGKAGATDGGLAPFRLVPDREVFAEYAGSASCRECHAAAFAQWTNSHHARAERPLDPAIDQAAFAPARSFQHGSQTSEARLAGGQFQIVTAGPANQREPFPVERVIGVDPLRQFLVPMPGGRYQVTEVAVDARSGDWFDVYGAEDRQPGEWGHWTGRGMTWNLMCAACHNTRLRKHYDPARDTYATSMAEMSVGCEACHGPMAEHVAWQKQHRAGPVATTNPAPSAKDPTLKRLDTRQMLDACGACHARRSELTGDFVPGAPFADHYALTIPDETDLYYPDGQVRDENYEFASFLGSRMHLAGVRCWDCHEPHSGRVPTTDNLLCLKCHDGRQTNAPIINPAAHSFHKADTPGGRCVDCHMPQTTYMQRHPRRDHGFTIPDPLLTKQHGIPNACNRCHSDQTADWALAAVEQWYGPRMNRPSRARAHAIARARAGDATVVPDLVKLAGGEPIPLWRAAAAGLLRSWVQESNVPPALLARLGDPEPLVRASAARALEPLVTAGEPEVASALGALLRDPVRAVRVEAAWALRATLDTNSVAGADLLHYLAQNADLPSSLLQAGVFHLDRGATERALGLLRRAVGMDGGSAPLRQALAVGLSTAGQAVEAVRELEAACQLAPREAEYRFRLGLALNEAGRLADAAAALAEAVKLEPRFVQAWYNLGLAYSALRQPEAALEALARAEVLDPSAAHIPYARATVLANAGRTDEARTAAARALAIRPAFAEAQALLEQLEAARR